MFFARFTPAQKWILILFAARTLRGNFTHICGFVYSLKRREMRRFLLCSLGNADMCGKILRMVSEVTAFFNAYIELSHAEQLCYFPHLSQEPQVQPPQQELPLRFRLTVSHIASPANAATMSITIKSPIFILTSHEIITPIRCTTHVTNHAATHCQITTFIAHLCPISRFIDAIAATQGV